jgi:hypothetical protein
MGATHENLHTDYVGPTSASVNRVVLILVRPFPVYPDKQTFSASVAMAR